MWKCANGTHNADTVTAGLTTEESRKRLAEFGENRISSQRHIGALALFIAQFKSPIILILIGAAIVSLFLQDHTDATLTLGNRTGERCARIQAGIPHREILLMKAEQK